MTSEAVEHFQKEYVQTAKYQFPLIQEYVSEASNALDYGGATGELADSLRLISKNVHVSEYDQNYLPVLRKKNYS
jgi:16S rRNA A1518/A1519 N6-dimethyltransferase RsmA/KsgA/DIM1 with predicted DNA glycosylase/AP lyase activity